MGTLSRVVSVAFQAGQEIPTRDAATQSVILVCRHSVSSALNYIVWSNWAEAVLFPMLKFWLRSARPDCGCCFDVESELI